MTRTWRRGSPVVPAALLLSVLSACAPERDVVATELGSAGATGGQGGSGGTAGETGPCATLAADRGPAVAWFDFEDAMGNAVIIDRIAQRPASVVGTLAVDVAGPAGCGRALAFGNNERYLQLDDDAVWNLPRGSIDAWLWVPAMIPNVMGIISRDEYGDHVGHFSVFLLEDATVMARLQQSDIGAPAAQLTLACSTEPLPPSSWAHFGFNFGPAGAALYVNGKLAMRTGTPGLDVGMVTCGQTAADPHIPDLTLPWIIGASIYASMDPPNARQFPFLNGAIDNLRISAVERNFQGAF
jgi:hypothetical protein